jgi:glycosyltransferase involved in cell wall biosynthesis
MSYHIALSRPFDLDAIERSAAADQRPRHVLWALQHRLDASVHQPDPQQVTSQDRRLAKLIGQPEHWALARTLVPQLGAGDVVFCAGEDVGFPLAILAKWHRSSAKFVVSVMAPDRPRVRGTLKLFNLQRHIPTFAVNTKLKAQSLSRWLSISSDRICILPEQTDNRFFTPGNAIAHKPRPLIVSGGLEQRDYKTLALATADMAVDVKICAVSPNASSRTSVAFPDSVPSYMALRRYDWPDLRQLYRDADVVVVPLLPNDYSAGLTTLIEAMACRRPAIITRTPGLAEDLIDEGVVLGVPPQDDPALASALRWLLSDRDFADRLAQRGYEAMLSRFTSDNHVQYLMSAMEAAAPSRLPLLSR